MKRILAVFLACLLFLCCAAAEDDDITISPEEEEYKVVLIDQDGIVLYLTGDIMTYELQKLACYPAVIENHTDQNIQLAHLLCNVNGCNTGFYAENMTVPAGYTYEGAIGFYLPETEDDFRDVKIWDLQLVVYSLSDLVNPMITTEEFSIDPELMDITEMENDV